VTIDGEPGPDDVLGIIIGRGAHYGGPFRVLQNSDPHRPELAYAILSGKSKWELGKFAVGVLFEALAAMPGAICGRAAEITVEAEPATYVQLDGDAYGGTPVRFTVEESERIILA
jgi:diacylglycerol kinase family enzyme